MRKNSIKNTRVNGAVQKELSTIIHSEIKDPRVASAGGAANLFTRLENLRSELYFLHRYRHWSRHRLATVRRVRCLEVLFTFGKAHKWADARTYLRKSKILLKKERTNET